MQHTQHMPGVDAPVGDLRIVRVNVSEYKGVVEGCQEVEEAFGEDAGAGAEVGGWL